MDETLEERACRLIDDLVEEGASQEQISEIGLIIWENSAIDIPEDEVIH